jgi:hypothetical protein
MLLDTVTLSIYGATQQLFTVTQVEKSNKTENLVVFSITASIIKWKSSNMVQFDSD